MRISDWSSDVCSSDLADVDRTIFGGVGLKKLRQNYPELSNEARVWAPLLQFSVGLPETPQGAKSCGRRWSRPRFEPERCPLLRQASSPDCQLRPHADGS